jgi:hypothetical protein
VQKITPVGPGWKNIRHADRHKFMYQMLMLSLKKGQPVISQGHYFEWLLRCEIILLVANFCRNTRGTARHQLNYVDYFYFANAVCLFIWCCWFCFTWCGECKKQKGKERVRERLVGCLSVCISLSLVGKGRRLRVLTGSFAAANKGHACKTKAATPPAPPPPLLQRSSLSHGWDAA